MKNLLFDRPTRNIGKLAIIFGVVFVLVLGITLLVQHSTAVQSGQKDIVDAIKAAHFEKAFELYDANVARYPVGSKRKKIDAAVRDAVEDQARRFVNLAGHGPLEGEALALVGLSLFEPMAYTRIEAGLSQEFTNFVEELSSYTLLEAKLENYRLLPFTQGIIEENSIGIQPLLQSREYITMGDTEREAGNLLSAAEYYRKVSATTDVMGYNYVAELWPALLVEMVADVRMKAQGEADASRYVTALAMLNTALEIAPQDPTLSTLRQTIQADSDRYSQQLQDYTGPVEHLFTHNLAVYGFGDASYGQSLDNDCITPDEFRAILEELYKHNYILIDINTLYTVENGVTKQATLKLPRNKKPFVLSFDDVNYYRSHIGQGMVDKLVIDDNGMVCGYTKFPDGREEYNYDEHIPIVEKFIAEHPDFAFNNARPTIALTGYDNVMGYYCRLSTPKDGFPPEFASLESRMAQREQCKKVIDRLKEMGWNFGSHTFGHVHVRKISEDALRQDAEQWKTEIQSMTGPTGVLIWSYGEWPETATEIKQKIMQEYGFKIFCGVGWKDPFLATRNRGTSDAFVFQDRRNLDGYSLRNAGSRFSHMFNTQLVYDTKNRLPPFSVQGYIDYRDWNNYARGQ